MRAGDILFYKFGKFWATLQGCVVDQTVCRFLDHIICSIVDHTVYRLMDISICQASGNSVTSGVDYFPLIHYSITTLRRLHIS